MYGTPDSGIQGVFACRVRNPGNLCLWSPESRALENIASNLDPTNNCNPESKLSLQRNRNPVAGIRNPRIGIQNRRLSWIPLQRRGGEDE